MLKCLIAVLCIAALLGCANTGNSSAEQEAMSKQWGQDAYEEAMIKAGKEDELKAEKEKWAESQGQQGQEQPLAPPGGN